jgi:tRNA threonylcarbamoyladenosine biosynthesis protein TsaE
MRESPTTLILANEEQTQQFAQGLASAIQFPLNLSFRGDLGAGKSTLVRALLRALGVTGPIKSPTFSLVESYPLTSGHWAHHFDLYRIDEESELDLIGFRDYFSFNTLCCIEWPERAGGRLPVMDVDFLLQHEGSGRLLEISFLSQSGLKLKSDLT